jgi:PAS domain S-box-containing protein
MSAPRPRQPRRPWLTLRGTLFAFAGGAVLYVAVIAAYLVFVLGPTIGALRRHSGLIAGEYQEVARRAEFFDSARVEVGRVLDSAAEIPPGRIPAADPSFSALRSRLQASFDTAAGLRTLTRLGEVPETLRVALGNVAFHESALGAAMLDAMAAVELRDIPRARDRLRAADSVDARLDRIVGNATALALQDLGEQERALAASAVGAARTLGVWVTLGLILLPLLLLYVHKRFLRPLSSLDRGLDRIMSGDLAQEVPLAFDDELGRVGTHFNETLAVLRQREALEKRLSADRVRARTRLILDAALDAVIAMDDRGLITEWNPQAQAVFGWRRDEVLGRPLSEMIIPPEYRAQHLAGLKRYLESGQARVLNRRLEIDGLHRSGERVPVELAITPIAQADGKVGFSAFVRDISTRRAAEMALRESEERYRAAFEQAAMGMAELDPSGRFLRVNRTFCDMLGYEPDELLRMSSSSITHPAEALEDRELISRVVAAERSSQTREKRFVKKTGAAIWAQVTLSLVRDTGGAPAYLLMVTQDIESRKRLEEELRQSQKLDAVGRLAGGVAHDFNNLLTGIIGYADLLRHSPDATPQLRQDADSILLAARRGADLTRNLLAFARRSTTRTEPVDLHAVILEVAELLERTFDRRIELRLTLEARPSVLLGDHSQLANAVLNLALNARDAMPHGGRLGFTTSIQEVDAEFVARHPASVQPGRHLVLRVSDNGEGMPPETMARAFEPFFTTKPTGKGTGLGLSMVYGTVKAHHGLVTVYSVPGAGSTFTLYLPLAESGVVALPARPADGLVPGVGRVLLADDEQTLREVGQRMLEQVGYVVETARNGEEALDLVRSAGVPFDLVILDWNMPRMGGREACRAIRALRPELRVILASGLAETAPPDELRADGFIGVVQKPYSMADLAEVVASHTALAAPDPQEPTSL